LKRFKRGRDPRGKHARRVELLDVGFGYAALVVIVIENRRSILPSDIIALPIQVRWVMCDRKENLQQLAECKLAGIKVDFYRLRVIGCSAAHCPIVRRLLGATGITGGNTCDSFKLSIHRFDTPETSTCKYGGLRGC